MHASCLLARFLHQSISRALHISVPAYQCMSRHVEASVCSGLSTREDRPRIRLLTRSPRAGLSRQIRSRAFCCFRAIPRAKSVSEWNAEFRHDQ